MTDPSTGPGNDDCFAFFIHGRRLGQSLHGFQQSTHNKEGGGGETYALDPDTGQPYSLAMCSRYELNTNSRQLARHFGLSTEPALPNRAEVRPTDQGLIVLPKSIGALHSWGFPAPWDGKPVFNARAETLTQKPTFRPFLGNRCIVPATSFPEWKKDGSNREKYIISLYSQDDTDEPTIMEFAGLFDDAHFTIITCAAAPLMAPIHSRMPVILTAEGKKKWLDPNLGIEEVVSSLLPYEEGDLLVTPDAAIANDKNSNVQGDLFI